MTFALNPETPTDLLKDLIVSDIAPVRAKASADTVSHIQGMEEVEASNVSSRKEANEILEKFEKVPIPVSPLTTIGRLTAVTGPQCPRIFID
jgi:crotonobetainyl-CoA:carnitine CoA-transferase CaiB-like acyl-CoA transferase